MGSGATWIGIGARGSKLGMEIGTMDSESNKTGRIKGESGSRTGIKVVSMALSSTSGTTSGTIEEEIEPRCFGSV